MFPKEVYTEDWIEEHRPRMGNCDPSILEKSVYALTLLGHLVESGLPFVFKGGTSMLILLPETRRLSIDIDIVSPASDQEVDRVVNAIGQKKPFIGSKEDPRESRGLPKRRHFHFFYNSQWRNGGETSVMLDVVREAEIVYETTKLPIQTGILKPDQEIIVELPNIESLLGDKLTAFAPMTTGVPFFIEKTGLPPKPHFQQVAKQLFDIGILFDHANDYSLVRKVYTDVHRQEVGYRGKQYTLEETLIDTSEHCLALIGHNIKNGPRSDKATHLIDGFGRLTGHLTWDKFGVDDRRTLAARTFNLATHLLKSPEINLKELRYTGDESQIQALRSASLSGSPYAWIDGTKANAEAYYYAHQAISLLNYSR